MKYNLFLIKAHYFLFFAALGPILPFLGVISKQLGISDVATGFIFSVVPVLYLVMKPLYGFVVDYFVGQRTFIFTVTVALMGLFYFVIYFIPHTSIQTKELIVNNFCSSDLFCNSEKNFFHNWTINQVCNLSCTDGIRETGVELRLLPEYCKKRENTSSTCNISHINCEIGCENPSPVLFVPTHVLIQKSQFWIFIIFMTLGSIGFNIINSASDAICLYTLGSGNEAQYGNQRLWGTVGYGITAFVAGYYIDYLSEESTTKNNTPAFILLMIFTVLDVIVCSRLKFPAISESHGIVNEAYQILKKPHVMIFTVFALFIGIFDGFFVYYLFWYLEELSVETGFFEKIRLIQGLTVLTESFGGELLIFPLAGKIIQKIGYGNSLTLCFLFFAIRFCILSFIPNPWWALPCEAVFHGLTYAFSYSTIVGYVSTISTLAIQGTMQGIVSGIYDGFGYALGSLSGGILCTIFTLREIFRIFSVMSFIVAFLYYLLYIIYLKQRIKMDKNAVYFVARETDKPVSINNEE